MSDATRLAAAGGPIELKVLGAFAVHAKSLTLGATQIKLRSAQRLLQMLALAPRHELHRDDVLERLWPETEPRVGVNRLHHTLHVLRSAFAKAGLPRETPVVTLSAGTLALSPACRFDVDAVRFRELIDKAREAIADPSLLQSLLEQAVARYGGELLEAEPEVDWFAAARERCRLDYCWALDRLAALLRAQQPERSIELYQRLVQIEPANESAHRALVELRETVAKSQQTPTRSRYVAPPQSYALYGREQDLGTLEGWIAAGARLVTITGTAGLGKTRLAHALAECAQERFADGVHAIALADLGDSRQLTDFVSRALGLEDRGEPAAVRLRRYLRERRVLMLLDRFEHVLDGAPLLAQWLREAPGLTVLVTSQAPLRVAAETLFELPSLVQRGPGAAVQLFRAVATQAKAPIDRPEDLAAVAQICIRLDGNPLAIQLAAAQTPLLSLGRLQKGLLERPLELLANPAGHAERAHRGLRGAIAWSHGLLNPTSRSVLAWLGVFPAAFSFDDAADVLAGLGGRETLRLAVQTLLDRHLLAHAAPQADRSHEVLLVLPDALRQFAREQAAKAGVWKRASAAHAAYFGDKVAAYSDSPQPGKTASAARYTQAHLADIKQSVAWHERRAPGAMYLKLLHAVSTLEFYATGAGHVTASLQSALGARATFSSTEERRYAAWCYYTLSRCSSWQAQQRQAVYALRTARRLARGCDDARLDGKIESHFAQLRMDKLRLRLARHHLERRIGGDGTEHDPGGLAWAHCALSFAHAMNGERTASRVAAESALKHALQADSAQLTILAHYRLASWEFCNGDVALARARLEPAMRMAERAGAVPLHLLQVFDAAMDVHAVEFERATERFLALRQHALAARSPRLSIAVALALDYTAIEDDRFEDVKTIDSLDDDAFPFDTMCSELSVALWWYRLRLYARRGHWEAAVRCVGRAADVLGRTRNGLWYAWLCDACCYALIDRGELHSCRVLLAQSQRFMREARLSPAPLQARTWQRIERAIRLGLGDEAMRREAPSTWEHASLQSLRLLQQCMSRSLLGGPADSAAVHQPSTASNLRCDMPSKVCVPRSDWPSWSS
jgi:predicted ATPase/DNA-binding SARP family transcriptional activator